MMESTNLIFLFQQRTDIPSLIHQCNFTRGVTADTICVVTSADQQRTQHDTHFKTISFLAPYGRRWGRNYQWLVMEKKTKRN
jgi:hypothetical protein